MARGIGARREIVVFSLSFLDVIASGFGAVILLFMVIAFQADWVTSTELKEPSEVDRMELKVEAGRKNLAQAREALAKLLEDLEKLRALREQKASDVELTKAEYDELLEDSNARREAIEKLREELAELESDKERLSARSVTPDRDGNRIRAFQGEGQRQYLTGLYMGGERIVILVDTSTSMLDRTLVNILRSRNFTPAQQSRMPKWRQVVNTVDWITTQIVPNTQVQVIAFTDTAASLIEGTDDQWVTVTDGSELEKAVQTLRAMHPEGPTSLQAAFAALTRLSPPPDNVYLLVDGLPTRGDVAPNRAGVSSNERLDHFYRALRELRDLPRDMRVNVILFPMEGDPLAAPAYWELALQTGGSLLAPSEDWP